MGNSLDGKGLTTSKTMSSLTFATKDRQLHEDDHCMYVLNWRLNRRGLVAWERVGDACGVLMDTSPALQLSQTCACKYVENKCNRGSVPMARAL